MAKSTVSMRRYVDAQIASLRAYVDAQALSDHRYEDMVDRKNEKAVELSDEALAERTKVALDAVTEHNVKSNGLIEMMRGMMGEFINWRVVMSFIAGVAAVASIYVAFMK